MKKNYFLLSILAILFFAKVSFSQTIWNGPTTTFSKANYADWTLSANQDQITANVAITRADDQGIFNIVSETSFSGGVSPADTEWAIGSIADYATLTYDSWRNTVQQCPPCEVGTDMVLHLITDDIYIDVKFTSWTQNGNGGGFSYERSNPPCTVFPNAPTVSTPVIYDQFDTATPLTATSGGDSLLWYDMATGGTGSVIAPNPSTDAPGSTSFWVSSVNNNGCESTTRSEIVVTVNPAATHLNFDGVNDIVDLGNGLTNYFTGRTAVTLEAWVRPESNSGLGVILGNYSYPTSTGTMQMMFRRNNNSYRLWIDGGAGFTSVEAVNTVTLNAWQHIAGTWDGVEMKIYVDGVLINTVAKTGTIPSKTTSFSIGGNAFAPTAEMFDGDIDDVRIWDTLRTENQISNSKDCELNGDETGLVAYYQFNQGVDAGDNTGLINLTDATANAYNGTLTNFALTGSSSNWLAGSPVVIGSSIPQTTDYTACQGQPVIGGLEATIVPSSSSVTSFSGDTTGAPTFERPDDDTSCFDSGNTGVNYTTHEFTVSSMGSYTFSLCGNATWDTFLALYEAPFNPAGGCAGNTFVASNDDNCANLESSVTAALNTGMDYVLVVTGFNDSEFGTYTVDIDQPVTSVIEGIEWYTAESGGMLISTESPFNPIGVPGSGIPDDSTTGSTSFWAQHPGSMCRTEAIFTINASPAEPTVTSPVNYNVGDTASPLTATSSGDGLLWYAVATGGTGSTTAPTPDTSSPNITSYWVSSSNNNGCESAREEIVVEVNSTTPATHLAFDGVNDRVDCGNGASIQITGNAITLEAMVKMKSFKGSPSDGNIINKEQNGPDNGYMLRVGGQGVVNFNIGDGSWNELNTPNNTLQLDVWYHVAATYDGTMMRIFVDGVEVASQPTSINIGNSTSNLFIGDWPNNGRNIDADIDEVRIWNITRTSSEVSDNQSCELDGNESGLVAYYNFNQGFDSSNNESQSTLLDATTNNNDGTLSNFDLINSDSNFMAGSPVTTGNSCSTLSTTSFDISNSINIYPNPAGDEVHITLLDLTDASVEVYDINGRTVLQHELNLNLNSLNISQLEMGIYLFKIKSQEGSATKRIIKI